jgi:hypothetical protein
MFDDLFKQLKKLERTGVSIPVKMDEEGYFDRECPNKDCLFQFKVFEEDWTNLCKDERIHCPLCGHQAPSKSWWTKEQLEGAEKQALGHVKAAIGRSLSEGAREFNRNQRPGLITMSMKVTGGPTYHSTVPVAAQEAMKLKIQCESCSTRFAVIGSAFFCPCCGFNSVERTFGDSLKKVEAKLDYLDTVRSALEELGDKDGAELTCRSLVESGINDCVVAFQKLMEALYLRMPGASKPSLNTFQRIDDGSKLWKQISGESYADWISEEDLKELTILFNRRHLLAHTEGFVDERYIEKSGDSGYSIGQRIVVQEKDVRHLASIVRTLASAARDKVSKAGPQP